MLDWHNQVSRRRSLDQYEVVCDGQCIRQKIYDFEGKKYLETWHNGKRIISLELCH